MWLKEGSLGLIFKPKEPSLSLVMYLLMFAYKTVSSNINGKYLVIKFIQGFYIQFCPLSQKLCVHSLSLCSLRYFPIPQLSKISKSFPSPLNTK